MTAFEWKTFFVWRVTYICVHVTQAQFLPTSSKHVSPGMRFLGLGIGGLSHQSCMSLHIGTNNIVGGSNNNGPNGHLFYVEGDLMMRRGMLPIIMLPDGDLRIVLHLVPF